MADRERESTVCLVLGQPPFVPPLDDLLLRPEHYVANLYLVPYYEQIVFSGLCIMHPLAAPLPSSPHSRPISCLTTTQIPSPYPQPLPD